MVMYIREIRTTASSIDNHTNAIMNSRSSTKAIIACLLVCMYGPFAIAYSLKQSPQRRHRCCPEKQGPPY